MVWVVFFFFLSETGFLCLNSPDSPGTHPVDQMTVSASRALGWKVCATTAHVVLLFLRQDCPEVYCVEKTEGFKGGRGVTTLSQVFNELVEY